MRITIAILIASVMALLTTLGGARADDKPEAAPAVHKNVGVEEFEKLTKQPGNVVLDVRTPSEYRNGHLKDAVLIDFMGKDFDEKVKGLDKSKTYLVHCQVGGRSAKACTKLDKLGFTNVINLEGGYKAWEKAGKPVEK
jgi:rhodanese-related sulfurtransferase